LDSHSRPSCQRADSPIFNPVSMTSVIVVAPQHRRDPVTTDTNGNRLDRHPFMAHETPGIRGFALGLPLPNMRSVDLL
jgi:hypothetical protein